MDVRTKYVNEFCENGIIKIIFISSSENISDIMSKNLSADLNAKHSAKLITKRIWELTEVITKIWKQIGEIPTRQMKEHWLCENRLLGYICDYKSIIQRKGVKIRGSYVEIFEQYFV